MATSVLMWILFGISGCDEIHNLAISADDLCDAMLVESNVTLDELGLDCADEEANCIAVACGNPSTSCDFETEVGAETPMVEVVVSVLLFAEAECSRASKDSLLYYNECGGEGGADMVVACID